MAEITTPKKKGENDAVTEPGSGEFLAKTRARRSRAGALMSTLINEEADDELALLFAEEDDDEEFEDEEEGKRATVAAADEEGEEGEAEADEMELDSSDDDEDDEGQGAEGGQEELTGEAELQRQAKAERLAKKRKGQEGLRIPALRKKVKIDQNLPTTAGGRTPTIPPARPRKKSERISWLPTAEDGPIRSSSRRQTKENKELTHARLKDNAKRRERQIQTMKEAAEQKAKMKPKQMTQADRLAEAAKTERDNSKSLSRWEEMEKKKSEEQRAKLEALQNRRLNGPVVTTWSGIAKWINDRLVQVGQKTLTFTSEADGANRKRRFKDGNQDRSKKAKSKEAADGLVHGEKPEAPKLEQPAQPEASTESQANTAEQPPNGDTATATTEGAPSAPDAPPGAPAGEEPRSFLDGIQLYASMNEAADSLPTQPPPADQVPKSQEQTELPRPPNQAEEPPQGSNDETSQHQDPQPPSDPQASNPPSKTEISSRNCIMLEQFDDMAPRERGEYGIFFNPRKPPKLQKIHQDICPITSLPARYRDPQTGLSYANSLAYREIRQLIMNRYAWSGMLGCFVGPVGVGARGVPERFLLPNAAPPQLPLATTPASTPTPGVGTVSGPGSVSGGGGGSGS